MTAGREFVLRQAARPGGITARQRAELIGCWAAVTNSGGAAGFPFPPVTAGQVAPVAAGLIAGLAPQTSRLLLATAGGRLAGWVSIRRDLNPLIAHWGSVHHLQTHPDFRGRGVGTALMGLARRAPARPRRRPRRDPHAAHPAVSKRAAGRPPGPEHKSRGSR